MHGREPVPTVQKQKMHGREPVPTVQKQKMHGREPVPNVQNVHPKVQEKSAKNGTFFSEKNGEKR